MVPLTAGAAMGRALSVLLLAALPSIGFAADRDVDAALRSMQPEIAEVRQSCNEPVTISAARVALSDSVTGVHVVLTSSICLGQWGKYDYLLVRDLDGQWKRLLGGPGPIRFAHRPGSHFARIDVSAMMGCELQFTWNGASYVRHGSPECAGGRKGAEWLILERAVRAAR